MLYSREPDKCNSLFKILQCKLGALQSTVKKNTNIKNVRYLVQNIKDKIMVKMFSNYQISIISHVKISYFYVCSDTTFLGSRNPCKTLQFM